MTLRYATIDRIKKLGRFPDQSWDPELELMIEAAELEVDHYCGRRFDSVTDTRPLYIRTPDLIPVGDWTSITRVVVENVVVAPGDWQARTYATGERPARDLRLTGHRANRGDTAMVTGTFGWPAVPAPITLAIVILAQRLFARGNHPIGLVVSPDGGPLSALPRQDPDVRRLLNPYRIPKYAAG